MADPGLEEAPPPIASAVIPLADVSLLEDYVVRICSLIFDLDEEALASFKAAVTEATTKAKLKAFATDTRSPVLAVSKRAVDGPPRR